jgi:hypothetical protein
MNQYSLLDRKLRKLAIIVTYISIDYMICKYLYQVEKYLGICDTFGNYDDLGNNQVFRGSLPSINCPLKK